MNANNIKKNLVFEKTKCKKKVKKKKIRVFVTLSVTEWKNWQEYPKSEYYYSYIQKYNY